MNIELKPVNTPEEIGLLCRLAKEAWEQAYSELLGLEQVEYMVEKFLSPPAVREQMDKEGYIYYLIYGEGEPGGFTGFAPGYGGRDELFLSKLYLLPHMKGTGAARTAFELIEHEARSRSLSRIRLTVNKGNTHAKEVYEHWGFETVESTVTDIGGGFVMDDYVMERRVRNA